MRKISSWPLGAALLASGCGDGSNEPAATGVPANNVAEAPGVSDPPLAANPAPANDEPVQKEPATRPGLSWESVSSGEGTSLRLTMPDGSLRLSISCLGDPPRLVVNAPGFTPIDSEDRFSFGLGSEPVTLVANPYAQEERPGVTGEGAIPRNLGKLLAAADRVSALYGTQQVGPHIPPPPELVRSLAVACEDIRTLG